METGNLLFWAATGLALGVVLLTSLVKNASWSGKFVNIFATILSVAGAGVLVVLSPDRSLNDAGDFMALATSSYGISQLIYNFIFKGTTVEKALANVSIVGDVTGTSPAPPKRGRHEKID